MFRVFGVQLLAEFCVSSFSNLSSAEGPISSRAVSAFGATPIAAPASLLFSHRQCLSEPSSMIRISKGPQSEATVDERQH